MLLVEHIRHLRMVFGPRNQQYMPATEQRLAFMTGGIKRLEDSVRKQRPDAYANRLASLFARWCAAAELLEPLDVIEAIAKKYGGGCSYCHRPSCRCTPSKRGPSVPQTDTSHNREWRLSDWQEHLKNVYGECNYARGVDFVLGRMFSEASEAQSAWLLATIPKMEITPEERQQHKRELLEELCDVFAWLLAAANILEVDLEQAVHEQYSKGCRHCSNPVCCCTWQIQKEKSF